MSKPDLRSWLGRIKAKIASLDVSRRLKRWFNLQEPSATLLRGGVALLVGLLSAAGIWLFKLLIDLTQTFFGTVKGALDPLGGWTLILLPVLGGLAVGLVARFLIGEERHHGVAGIIEAVALAGGRLRYKRIPAKTLTSVISIGSGGSVGPEDPSVQIGANIGSMFGQWLSLPEERIRTLVAAGAAAGISAAFNAPIAGVFFALEVILGEIGGSALGTIVVTSVASAVFTQAVSGAQPAFHVSAYEFKSAWELPLYLGLGLLAGPISAVYIRLLYFFQDLFHKILIPSWTKPALAGLFVGIVGLFLPQALGVGYDTIGNILDGNIGILGLLAAMLIAKLVLTPLSLGGGFRGGVVAPSLFMGATLGGAYGILAGQIFPSLGLVPPAFAMVGMAAVLAGALHAPLMAILLLFEMTGDYHIILPLMFAVAVSLLISQQLQRESIYTLGLVRKGIRLERGRDVEILETITVEEVMHSSPFSLLDTVTLSEAAEKLIQNRHHGAPVVDKDGNLFGIFTLEDLDRNEPDSWAGRTVGEVCTRQLVVTYPDETIGIALRKMSSGDIGRLPVVERENLRHLLGLLQREDLVRAYDAALTRRAALRHRAQQVRLDAITPEMVNVLEITVQPGSQCAGLPMKEVPWPHDCLIASLRRGRQVLIPRGDTIVKPGDVLVVVSETKAWEDVEQLCAAKD